MLACLNDDVNPLESLVFIGKEELRREVST